MHSGPPKTKHPTVYMEQRKFEKDVTQVLDRALGDARDTGVARGVKPEVMARTAGFVIREKGLKISTDTRTQLDKLQTRFERALEGVLANTTDSARAAFRAQMLIIEKSAQHGKPGPENVWSLEELQTECAQRKAGYRTAMCETTAEALTLAQPFAIQFCQTASDLADTMEVVERDQCTSFAVEFQPSRSLDALRKCAAAVAARVMQCRPNSGMSPVSIFDFMFPGTDAKSAK